MYITESYGEMDKHMNLANRVLKKELCSFRTKKSPYTLFFSFPPS
jgi:hypothetical protein